MACGPEGCSVVTGDADGHGEGDPVWVDAGCPRSVGSQRAQCLVDDQVGVQFLARQVRGPGAEDEFRPAQPGLQLTVAVFDFPALVVNGGELPGRTCSQSRSVAAAGTARS